MKKFSPSILISCLVLASSAMLSPTYAGVFDDDEARKAILDLRAKLNTLNDQVMAKADKSVILDQINQFDVMRQEIAQLRGQVEVLTNEVNENQRRQKEFYADLDNRLRKLEPQKVVVDGKEQQVEQNEQKSYNTAVAVFQSGDYAGAANALHTFIKTHPRSAYVPNAQYSLGIAYYAQKNYKGAIATFQSLIKAQPNNPKAPDALLNMASCYLEQKDSATAKKVLQNLINQYPDSSAAKTAQERLNVLK